KKKEEEHISERELLYKVLFDMKKDMNELKKVVADMLEKSDTETSLEQTKALMVKDYSEGVLNVPDNTVHEVHISPADQDEIEKFHSSEVIEESLSLQEKEKEMIIKALEKYNGKRKSAAKELGISERTLYRKIKEYNINN
ncbi:MAG: sigma-54-dependent Fis family transcriptional regulator, partial [Bacteroidetes bacterium]